jgi:hypothetical protein
VEHQVAEHPQTAAALEEAKFLYGIIAEFDDAHAIVRAAQKAYAAGYRKMDGYTPLPVEGLSEALGQRDYFIPQLMLVGGILGGIGGFSLLYFTTAIAYPLNIGGRPLWAWPSWIPITFECIVLLSALAGVFGMFALNGLPQPYHPVFDHPEFDRASSDRFFLCIEAEDPRFDPVRTRAFMDTLGALDVSEIELRK